MNYNIRVFLFRVKDKKTENTPDMCGHFLVWPVLVWLLKPDECGRNEQSWELGHTCNVYRAVRSRASSSDGYVHMCVHTRFNLRQDTGRGALDTAREGGQMETTGWCNEVVMRVVRVPNEGYSAQCGMISQNKAQWSWAPQFCAQPLK